MTPAQIIDHLQLSPHPEGGHYRQTWADDTGTDRPTGTCIYFLLQRGERSHWHRVDATEIWLYHAGAPLTLHMAETDAGPATAHLLTPDLTQGAPQLIVPRGHWQSAETTGDYTLVSCTVSPGFRFDGFTLAPAEFTIP
ncbi:cupin domain-containing protein [Sulfitobacter sp. JB4-11]|uniref:cupin domain-containing protein n=1 Tax=Sulfitobacter rhodophyticola TaxID=3238304 RepID=UPI003517C671